ncbi:MAG: hypothetical protein AB7F28_06415 [Candidatus Margulisiibacteriota bacterium]
MPTPVITLFADKLSIGAKTLPVSFFEWINQPNPTLSTLISEPLPSKAAISLSPCLIQTLDQLPHSKSTALTLIEKALYPHPVKTLLNTNALFGLTHNGWLYLPCVVLLLGWAVSSWIPQKPLPTPASPLKTVLPFLESMDAEGFLTLRLAFKANHLTFSGIASATSDLEAPLSHTDHTITALNDGVNTIEGTLKCPSF